MSHHLSDWLTSAAAGWLEFNIEVMMCIWMYLSEEQDMTSTCPELEYASLWRIRPQARLLPSSDRKHETKEGESDIDLEAPASQLILTCSRYLHVHAKEHIDRVLQPWLHDQQTNVNDTTLWTYREIGGHFARKWQLLHRVLKEDNIPHVILEPIVLTLSITQQNEQIVTCEAPSAAWHYRWQRICHESDVRLITCPVRYQQPRFNHVACMMIDRAVLRINWFDPSGQWNEATKMIRDQLQQFVNTYMFTTNTVQIQPVYSGPQRVTQDDQCGNWTMLFALLCNRYPHHSYQKWLFPLCAPHPQQLKRAQCILQHFDVWLRHQASRFFTTQ